jgi:O-antigen/teichoic acid export membrane protein
MFGASRVATALAMLAWQVVLARQLGIEAYGVYGTVAALMAVGAVIPDPGLGVIQVRNVARQPGDAGRYLGVVVAWHTILAVAGYLVLQAAAALLGYGPDVRALVAFAAVSLLVDSVGTAAHNQLVAAERLALAAMISIGHVTLLVIAGAAALAAGGGIWSVYAVIVGCGLARAGAYWIVIRAAGWRAVRPDRAIARHVIQAGLPIGLAAALALGLMHADKLVTTAVLGPAATAQLMTAFVIVFGVVDLVGSSVLVAVLPAMSRLARDRATDSLQSALHHLVVFDVLVGVPVAGLVGLYGASMSAMLFGHAYAEGAGLLAVLGWYIVLHLVEGAFAQNLTVQDRQRALLVTRAAGLVVNLAATIALLPRIGLVGAACGMVAGDLVAIAGAAGLSRLPAAWWRRLARQVTAFAPATLAFVAIATLSPDGVPVLLTAAVSATAYVLVVLVTGVLPRRQRELLAAAIRELPGGPSVLGWWG